MDGDRKINISEGVPLNSSGAANIFLNTGKNPKVNDGTVIHLNTEKPADVGVHINTTFSIASSKKIKLLFILNFLLSILCVVVCCWIAFYYWSEMISMRKQLDVLKEQLLIQNKDFALNQDKAMQSPLMSHLKPQVKSSEGREPRMEFGTKDELLSLKTRRYYVEDLGEDMLLVDSRKKNPNQDQVPVYELTGFHKDTVVVHFNGAMREKNMGTQSNIGPWALDAEVSSKDSEKFIELNTDHVTVKQSGIYLIYAQVVYLTHAPNCYYVWAWRPSLPAREPRLLSSCATGDVGASRPLDKSQMSCSVQTVASLYKGETIYLAQREHNRTLWLRPGYTYFGFVKLSS